MITQECLKELFDYREDGYLIYKSKRSRCYGKIAGTINVHGYRMLTINRKKIKAARAIWLWHYGWLPKIADHDDHDILNDRIGNLRAATDAQNAANARLRSDNKAGLKGVSFDKTRNTKPWCAHICVNGKRKNLGRYATKEEAYEVYCKAAKEAFGEFFCVEKPATQPFPYGTEWRKKRRKKAA